MLRGLLAGAGGAAAYTYKDSITDALQKTSVSQDVRTPEVKTDNSKEIEELRKLLMEQNKKQAVTVVHSGGKGGTPLIVYPTVALIAYLTYLRVFKGYRLADLMYVSKAALQQSVGQVKGGIEKLKDQMDNAKKFLQKQMDQLGELQKQLMSAQENMGKQLTIVDKVVSETSEGVSKVSGAVRQLDDRMVDVAQSQKYTERGVFLLCRVVQEIMHINGSVSKNANALTDFLGASPPMRIEDGEASQNGGHSGSGLQGLGGLQRQLTGAKNSISSRFYQQDKNNKQ